MLCRVCGKPIGIWDRELFRRLCTACAAGTSRASRSRASNRRCSALWAATSGDLTARPYWGDASALAVTSLLVGLGMFAAPYAPYAIGFLARGGQTVAHAAHVSARGLALHLGYGVAVYAAGCPLYSARDELLWQRWRVHWSAFSAAFWGLTFVAEGWTTRGQSGIPLPYLALLVVGAAFVAAGVGLVAARLMDAGGVRRASYALARWRSREDTA